MSLGRFFSTVEKIPLSILNGLCATILWISFAERTRHSVYRNFKNFINYVLMRPIIFDNTLTRAYVQGNKVTCLHKAFVRRIMLAKKVHFCSRCVCSTSAVMIFLRFQSFNNRLIQNASKERYRASSNIHFSINTENRANVATHKSDANDYFHPEKVSNQRVSLLESTSKYSRW